MKLIADCGATKSHWALVKDDGPFSLFETTGINALHISQDGIYNIVATELLPYISDISGVSEIYFYGAGVVDVLIKKRVACALQQVFQKAVIEVETDLMGAARALCGHNPGIACILGTGSNSCLYDGRQIVANVSPLGYILGDEGSGAVLGKKLIADVLKYQLPSEIADKFMRQYNLDYATLIKRIYREPGANKYMASFVPFLKENIDVPQINSLVVNAFKEFFERNIAQYPDASALPVNFIGSVAYHFLTQLGEAATLSGFSIGEIIQSPMQGLIAYHSA